MFTTIGVLLILGAIALIGMHLFTDKKESEGFIPNFGFKKFMGVFGFGLGFILLGISLFYAEPGEQYVIVGPTGNKTAITAEGYHLIMPGSRIMPWQKFIDVKVPMKNMDEDAIDEIEGKMSPIGIRFIDQVTAKALVSIRFQLPQDDSTFIALAIKYRTMTNLVNNTLIPTVGEQMVNTAYMYTANDYISGSAQSFRATFEEQLKGGAYAVKKTSIHDTIYNMDSVKGQWIPRGVKEIKTTYKVSKVLDKNGRPMRLAHEVSTNKIIVSQVIVDRVMLEKTFKERLEKQRDQSALRQLEIQKIETAKSTTQRVLAQGETKKAKERVAKETEAITKLVTENTILEKEKIKLEQAAIKYNKDLIEAKSVKVKADAKAYELSRADGLSEEVKFIETQKTKRTEVMAKAIENAKWPSTFVSGGSGNGKTGSIMEQMVGANLATKFLETK